MSKSANGTSLTVAEMFEGDDAAFDTLLADAATGSATSWEKAFVSDLNARYEKYGDKMFLSAAQLEQLERIAEQA